MLPRDSDLFKKENLLVFDTVSHQDYGGKKGERYAIVKPKDSDILCGDGSFMSQTQKNADYLAQKGERCDIKRPVSSDIWKHDGKLETESVSRQDFSAKKIERYTVKKPSDSDILHGDGSFRAETHSQAEFMAKKGDRFETVKPSSSGIWKEQQKKIECDDAVKKTVASPENINTAYTECTVCDNLNRSDRRLGNLRAAYTETFYEGVRPEDVERIIKHGKQQVKLPETHLEGQSIYQTSFKMPPASGAPVRIKSVGKFHESTFRQSREMKLESQYNADFVPKLIPCPAGELIESIAKNHSSTEHFEFYRILGGHHFYEPKADNV
uniref:JmjN domain-containing protein n=1 Tax=Setaria digitata TaxID=48799 RepID=A0A915PRD9_9BILA